MRVLIFSRIFTQPFLILRRIQRDILTDIQKYSRKIPFISIKLWSNVNFFGRCSKSLQIFNFVKIRPVGAGVFEAERTGRWTDMATLILAFRRFVMASKKKDVTWWNTVIGLGFLNFLFNQRLIIMGETLYKFLLFRSRTACNQYSPYHHNRNLKKSSCKVSGSVRNIYVRYTGCFTTSGHNCRRWFPRSLWSKSSYKHVSDFGRLRSYGRF